MRTAGLCIGPTTYQRRVAVFGGALCTVSGMAREVRSIWSGASSARPIVCVERSASQRTAYWRVSSAESITVAYTPLRQAARHTSLFCFFRQSPKI